MITRGDSGVAVIGADGLEDLAVLGVDDFDAGNRCYSRAST